MILFWVPYTCEKVRLLYLKLIEKMLGTSTSLSDFKANRVEFEKLRGGLVYTTLLDMAKGVRTSLGSKKMCPIQDYTEAEKITPRQIFNCD